MTFRQGRITRRQFLAVSAATLGAGALAACAPAATPATGPGEAAGAVDAAPTEVLYWDWWGPTGSAVNQALFDRLPVAVQEYDSSLQLEYQNVPFGEYFVKFLAAHAAGDVPDTMHSSVYWGRDFFDRDALLDLTSYIEVTPDLAPDQFIDGALLQAVKGPAQYGVPGEGPDSNQIFFNVDYFEEAGISTDPDVLATWDWADFTAAAQELTVRDGDEVTRSGFLVAVPNAQTLSVWASCHDVDFYAKDASGLENGIGFNDRNAAVNGLNWFLDMLYDAGVSQPVGPERQDWNQFMQGTTAMVSSGPWQYGQLRVNVPDLNWSVMLWPAAPVDEGKQGTAVWNNMLVMPTRARNPDAGWRLLEFWCSLDWMLERLAIGEWLAPRKDFYETTEYLTALENNPAFAMVPKASATGTPLVYIQQAALDAEIQPVLEAVILQQQSPDSAVEELVMKGNEILEQAGYA